jgi:hypothetical protein
LEALRLLLKLHQAGFELSALATSPEEPVKRGLSSLPGRELLLDLLDLRNGRGQLSVDVTSPGRQSLQGRIDPAPFTQGIHSGL